jgi:hypothetical protein
LGRQHAAGGFESNILQPLGFFKFEPSDRHGRN